MDQEIIGYLHSGDTVEIVEKCGDWYKVNFNGKTGYAHGKYLNVTDSAKDSSMFNEDALQLPEDDGDEDEEVDVNEDYEAESDDEPV